MCPDKQEAYDFIYLFIYFFAKNSGTSTLQHLQGTLEGQPLYVELLQEVSPGHSPGAQTVLATFETSAVEFLFPYPQLRPTYTSGVDVDLLMEPTRDFPGIISPKVSSRLCDEVHLHNKVNKVRGFPAQRTQFDLVFHYVRILH